MSQQTTYRTELEFQLEPQIGINLCWASIATAICNYYNPITPKEQMDFVEEVLGIRQDKIWYAQKALEKTNHLRAVIDGAISLTQLKEEIQAGNPVVAKIEFGYGPNHLVCLTGYKNNEIKVDDPKYSSGYCDYETFRTDYRKFGKWTTSYLIKS